jgi:hypothetical protein
MSVTSARRKNGAVRDGEGETWRPSCILQIAVLGVAALR